MKRRCRSIYLLLSAGCAIVAGVIALAAGIEAYRQNQASLDTQRAVADFETNDAYLEMLGLIKHTANDITIYRNTTHRFDRAWLTTHFNQYLSLIGIENAALFAADGKQRALDSTNPKLAPLDISAAPGVQTLLAAVRNDIGNKREEPRQGIIIIGGKPYFAVAAAIQPFDVSGNETVAPAPNTAIFFTLAKDAHYALLSVGFDAKDVHIAAQQSSNGALASFPLNDAAGRPLAFLQWRPHKPGFSFLMVLFPVLFVMFAALAATLAVSFCRWQRAQKQLLETEAKVAAAEEESRVKSVFLGNVSHELRTPLNAIIGFAEMLDMKLFGPLGAKQYDEYTTDILTSGKELLRIVNDLIEFSNIDDLHSSIPCETIDAARCLKEAFAGARAHGAVKSVTLRLEGDNAGAWCTASCVHLHKALSRLLENALRRSGEGQSVSAFWHREENEIVLGVRDQGPRLEQEQAQNVGKLFLNTDTHMISRKDGLGLSLAIAVGLAKAMGGRIAVDCGEGNGCTMLLHMPVAAAPENTETQAA